MYTRKGERWEKLDIPFWIGWTVLVFSLAILKVYGIIDHLGTGKGRFPVPLLLFYALELLGCYFVLKLKGWPFPKRISMAFLLTFFSSYFWEFPLHVLDLLENGLTDRFLIQSIRLLPLVFFWMIFEVKDRKSLLNYVFMAHLITLGIFYLELSNCLSSDWTFLVRGLNFLILMLVFFDGNVLELRSSTHKYFLKENGMA